ncbi:MULTISPECIES: hypothetical protein [unclassified Pseudomonas]|uniref:hypothetical protein n=1 Tax=unclassified Pseudomonas TaxID=196821 RepID=UPI000A1E3FB8|nr:MULTISPECIES: hypothetical protein [unclassified Pseudomonas]
MTLLENVEQTCKRLAPGGWQSLMRAHGLDLSAVPLDVELLKPLTIDRTLPGFEDFSMAGFRAIEPGEPSRSLLFHALASARVTLDATGQPLQLFPSPAEIETLLDLVFGIRPPTLDELRQRARGAPLAVAVFACEYRCAVDTVHGVHADLCFSRTGIARVGTAAARYDTRLRSHLPWVDDDAYGIRVMPVRYSAYVAVQLKGDAERFGPLDFQEDIDDGLDFWVPLHKLFEGPECIAGMELTLRLDNHQINEKLRHIHLRHAGTGWQEPEISQPPFVISEGLAYWADPADRGPGLLLPQVRPRLVEPACLDGQPLAFQMPAGTAGMVHGRHKLNEDGSIEDLNDREGVGELVDRGGYRTLHYHDGTADGWVRAHCLPLNTQMPSVAAYSVIGPPDFFPLCTQRRLLTWVNHEPVIPDPDIWHARLQALSNVRYCANLALKDQPFSPDDRSVTAIVAQLRHTSVPPSGDLQPAIARPTSLPDGAAGVFGPGWETGWIRQRMPDDSWINVLAGYQMASPFTEDIRICAALGSFWPGTAPDSAQTFEPRRTLHSIIPLTDGETGQGAVAWDHQQRPQLIQDQGRTLARYRAYEYSDYTQVALDNRFSLQQTGAVDQQAYQNRVLSMYRVYNALGAGQNDAERNRWPVLSFQSVLRPDPELDLAERQAGTALDGWVHRYRMYRRGDVSTPAGDFKRRDVEVQEQVSLFVSVAAMLLKTDGAPWRLVLEPL